MWQHRVRPTFVLIYIYEVVKNSRYSFWPTYRRRSPRSPRVTRTQHKIKLSNPRQNEKGFTWHYSLKYVNHTYIQYIDILSSHCLLYSYHLISNCFILCWMFYRTSPVMFLYINVNFVCQIEQNKSVNVLYRKVLL